MYTNKLLIGMLASFFAFCMAGQVVAKDCGTASVPLDKTVAMQNPVGVDIDFDYSPRSEGAGMAAVASGIEDSEVIEFDYSPVSVSSGMASMSTQDAGVEQIEFDYSPRPVDCGSANC